MATNGGVSMGEKTSYEERREKRWRIIKERDEWERGLDTCFAHSGSNMTGANLVWKDNKGRNVS